MAQNNTSPKQHDDSAPVRKDASMYDTQPVPKKRLRPIHMVLAGALVVAAFVLLILDGPSDQPVAETAAPENNLAPSDPPPPNGIVPDTGAPAAATDLAPQNTPPAEAPPEPAATITPPPSAEPAVEEPPAETASVEETPTPAVKTAKSTRAKSTGKNVKKAATKKHTMTLSRANTKIPKGLKKDRVLAFLAKKLDGDKTCVPANAPKKDLRAFTAVLNFSKSGALTAVTTQPKLSVSKAVSACIKKKLAGQPALFKSKSTSRVSVSLKIK